ncbi:MAG TPA: hypothetical protein VKU00_05040 [Chthonomonadaceae bacterium]|nr:hypothetical protein [Chthonomonadaceae bacterium]
MMVILMTQARQSGVGTVPRNRAERLPGDRAVIRQGRIHSNV